MTYFVVYLTVFTTFSIIPFLQNDINRISGVMISMPDSNVVNCDLEPWSGQTKDLKKWYVLFLR